MLCSIVKGTIPIERCYHFFKLHKATGVSLRSPEQKFKNHFDVISMCSLPSQT